VWELIVVDDSSTDDTAQIASENADRVIRLADGPRGPAFARNRGVEATRSAIVAFVDADVVVHPDALKRILSDLDKRPIDAVIGSYDNSPAHPGMVSQYRNLLHHFVHQQAAHEVESFWAGCGAIRRDAFLAAGGFDEDRYHFPEMEDVELGYRLRDHGSRILLDPLVLGTHRKRWTLTSMVKADFLRRGLPWTRLLIGRKMLLSPRGLSLGAAERGGALFAALLAVLLVAAIVTRSAAVLLLASAALAGFFLTSWSFLRFIGRTRGLPAAVAAVPLHILYNVVAVSAFACGIIERLFVSRTAQERYTRRQ
jgi:hypothetical protein